ncbi:unnamed protein product [Calypogeia fissa]
MLGVARFFWRRYVAQARQLIETIRESDRKRYQRETGIINRVEALYLHYSQKGDIDEKYLEIVRPEYIADLFFQGGRLLHLDEALEVLATDFYGLPGCGYLSKYVFREVAVKGMDHIPVVEKERAVREGRAVHDVAGGSNPPTGSDRPPTPKAPRWAEPDRVATPPEEPVGDEAVDDVLSDTTAGPGDLGPHEDPEGLTPGDNAEASGLADQGDNQGTEVIVPDSEGDKVLKGDKEPEEEYAKENTTQGNTEEEEMQFFSIPREIITLAQRPEHDQFWKDMGLYAFVHLQWNTTIGTMAECAEFVKHSTPVATLVGEEVIHLLEEDVAGFFHLGMAKTKDIAARARSWQSQKFTAPKEKNGYKLNTCTDKNLVERLEFIRAALYLQERRNVITGVQVREVEEVRGGSNWAKHLFKQLHHDLDVARSTKKCRALNHIRIIFLALARDKKQKEAATEDAPPGFPAPQGTKGLQGVGMTIPAGGAKSAMRGAAGAKAKPPPK